MEKHFELSDNEFIKQFYNCKLNPDVFTHEAHLRLAWINIKKDGVLTAEENILNGLQKYVTHLGAKDKFNKTLTVAAIKAVYHFMIKSKAEDFKAFISEFSRLKYNFKELMACHYGFDIYNSSMAKTEYLQPDLIPFD